MSLIKEKGFNHDRYNCFNAVAGTDTDLDIAGVTEPEKHSLSAV
jgi:hypothetical protein